MTQYLTIPLAVLLAGSTGMAATESSTPATMVRLSANYETARGEYLKKYVSVQDVWAGWMPTSGDMSEIHIVTGRIMNTGNKMVIVNEVRVALLDDQGKVLDEKQIVAYPDQTIWQPQLGPGQSAGFNELLPPTVGVPPLDWTGEVRVTVTSIELP